MMMLRLEQVRRFGSLQRSVRIATRIEVLKNGGSGLFIRGFSSGASSFENNHGPLAVYKRRVEKNLVSQDPLQLEALNHFERLHHECIDYEKAFQQLKQTTFTSPTPTVEGDSTQEEGGWWFSLWSSSAATIAEALPRKPSTTPKSLYLWGSTGCGKTYLMDLFFENLPIKLKKRIHFHDFMIDIHKRLHALKNNNNTSSSHTTEKSLQKIANQIMEESILICFDEFQVTDIADAMLLRLLFEELFQQGLILIATSNRPPTELYKNGIQRDLFIPFIHLLEEKSDIFSFIPKDHVKIDQSTIVKDYRLVKYQHLAKNIYFFPIDSVNESAILKQFDEYCPSYSTINFFDHLMIPSTYTADLTVFGHIFHVPSIIHGRRVAKFTFQDICNRAYGAADFIALSKVFHVICLVNVPKLSTNSRDEMRRFITLVDAVYESKSLLLILADSNPMQLLNIDEEQRKTAVYDEVFAFDRTVSRLLEMQSTDYVKAALEAFPQGQDFLATVLTELKIRSKQDRHVSSSHMQSASHPHFHNDHNSMLWVLRKVWSHYRLGTVGELKAALTMTSNLEGSLNISNLSLAAENKQTMERDTFLIMLGDIVDYYFRDMQGNELKQKMIIDALSQIQNKHKGEYISFSHYVSTVLELIELIHR